MKIGATAWPRILSPREVFALVAPIGARIRTRQTPTTAFLMYSCYFPKRVPVGPHVQSAPLDFSHLNMLTQSPRTYLAPTTLCGTEDRDPSELSVLEWRTQCSTSSILGSSTGISIHRYQEARWVSLFQAMHSEGWADRICFASKT